MGCWTSSIVSTCSMLGIFEVDAWRERFDDGDVDIFVDRRGDQKALVLAVIGRQIGAAAAKGDAQRTTNDDHSQNPCRSAR